MSRARWLGGATVVVAIVAAACTPANPSPGPQEPFTAAIVRGDGFLVPFASYADGVWSGPPIEPGSAYGDWPTVVDRDAAWFDVATDDRRRWQTPAFHPVQGERRAPLPVEAVGDPMTVAAHCESAWALATRLDQPATPDGSEHHVRHAAFSRPVPTIDIAELDSSLPAPPRLLAVLTGAFDAAETAAVEQRDADDLHGPRRSGAGEAKTPLAFSRLFRVGGRDGWSIYLFEAARTYERAGPAGPGCDDASVMTGWLAESPWGGFTILSSDFVFTDCDRKGSAVLTPLATLDLDDRTYTIVLAHDYESESYRVFQVEHDAVREVLDVYGGGC